MSSRFTSFRDRELDAQSDDGDELGNDLPPSILQSDFESESPPAEGNRRSPSPTPSVASMTSSLREQAYMVEYGRGMNAHSDVYRLPADDEELERLDRQHIMFMNVMGKYCPRLEAILTDNDTEEKAVLDLGCGSGAWIMDVARDFPHVSCVAVDLVPLQSPTMPPNCRAEVDDINLGLEHFYGRFNVVHTRIISSGIKDFRLLVEHIAHSLKPGGLIDCAELDFTLHDANRNPIMLDPTTLDGPWFPRWMTLAKQAALQRGADVNAASRLRAWVTSHGAFEDIVSRQFWLPTCPWQKGDDQQTAWWRGVGEVMREDIFDFLKAGRPLLLGSGLSEAVVLQLEDKAKRELNECSHECFVRVQNVYAIKRQGASRPILVDCAATD